MGMVAPSTADKMRRLSVPLIFIMNGNLVVTNRTELSFAFSNPRQTVVRVEKVVVEIFSS
jgi:hypothetical protein